MIKKIIVLALMSIFSNPSFSAERGLDPITAITDSNLVCGKVDGKFIIFSVEKNKVWYIFADQDKDTDSVLRNSRSATDLNGLKAYTYSLSNNRYPLPTIEKGSGAVVVTYKLDYGSNGRFLSVRNDSHGTLRIFIGEDGRNGRCWFLNN